MSNSTVTIVGAPNVGKSTLFNRLLGRRRAIVSDRPGVTRDRIAAECDLFGRAITLVDTGGVGAPAADDLARSVRREALKAVEEGDLVLFVVDARAGLTAIDLEVAALLRASRKPIIAVANKIDAAGLEGHEFELYRLGLGEVVPLSAEQGRGLDDLVDRIRGVLPAAAPATETRAVPLAIVGRPNVGKSSLFNRFVRQERALVTPIPGTTRDPVDALFDHGGVTYRVVDTAGIRRRAGRGEEVERVSVLKAREALREAQIVVALIDASVGVEHQDRAMLGLVRQSRVPAVVAANKIDLLQSGERGALRERLGEMRAALSFASYVPLVPVSALTGRGVGEVLEAVAALRLEGLRRFEGADLGRALERVTREKQPPAEGGRPVRFYSMAQTGTAPLRFAIFTNGGRVHPTYRRFMEGRFRNLLGLVSSPLLLGFRRRGRSR
jgi:GTP-binding protein